MTRRATLPAKRFPRSSGGRPRHAQKRFPRSSGGRIGTLHNVFPKLRRPHAPRHATTLSPKLRRVRDTARSARTLANACERFEDLVAVTASRDSPCGVRRSAYTLFGRQEARSAVAVQLCIHAVGFCSKLAKFRLFRVRLGRVQCRVQDLVLACRLRISGGLSACLVL